MNTTTQLAAQAMNSDAPAAKVAHAALFERIIERIHRYFLRMVRHGHDADECLQQTLMLLEQSLVHGKYEAGRSFNTWMWLKAHTVFAQWCRARSKRPVSLPDEALVGRPSGDQERTDQRLDATRVLEEVREQLGEETYEAFVLYYEGGLTQAEVAEAQGHDRKTVRKRLGQAHALIDRLLNT